MKKIFAIIFLIFIFIPVVVLAQGAPVTPPANPCSLAGINPGEGAATTLPRCVNQIYVWSLGIAVLLAMLMIVIGGYFYMTSGGNAEQASKGKEYITSALIGVVILFCAYLLLNTINPDLVKFNLDSLRGLDSNSPSTQPNQNPLPGSIRQPDPTTPPQQPAQNNLIP